MARRRTVGLRPRWLLFSAALLVAASGLGAQAPADGERDSTIAITFLDVGQGDATIIHAPGGRRILIDAGRSRPAIERHLREGGDTLDLVIASHAHSDHIGGMPWVFRRFVVRAYMDNGIPHTTATYRQTVAALESEPGVRYLQATERTVTVGSVALRILPPLLRDSSQNDNSVGVVLEFGKFSALITGDSEQRQLDGWAREARIPRVQVLKASHHGAWNGYTPTLAQLAQPGVVVISVAARNGYGHPSASVLNAWRHRGATIFRTDTHGSVMIVAKRDGSFRVAPRSNVLTAPLRRPND